MAMNQVSTESLPLSRDPQLISVTAISAVARPQPLHPADRLLLRPPTALGKGAASARDASFLRRTEYTTSHMSGGMKFESSNSSNTMRVRKKRVRANVSEDDPINIARHIIKSFNIAYPQDTYTGPDSASNLRGADVLPEEKQAWKVPKHPRDAKLQLHSSYPLLPDLDATPDTGHYMMFKFSAPPVKTSDGSYDPRLDVALLRPLGQTVEDQALFLHEQEAHKEDPTLPQPLPRYQYEFFLPPERAKVHAIRRNFTENDPDDATLPFDLAADPDDPDAPPRKYFKFENIRTYETEKQSADPDDTYGDFVALALHDPDAHEDDALRSGTLVKGAYFYPIVQRTQIRGRRPGRINLVGDEAQKVHVIEAVARPPEGEVERRNEKRMLYDPPEV